MMTELPGYDAWKTTEPRNPDAEWAEANELANEVGGEAFDDAAEWASLFDALGFEGEGPDPHLEAQRAAADILTRARHCLAPFGVCL